MMKRAFEVLWITNYMQDIRADFFAIYHIPDWETLDGPLFVSLAERLPMYEGALQARIKLENATEDTRHTEHDSEDSEFTAGQIMSMSEALSGGSKIDALNAESVKQGWGELFEIQKG